MRILTKKKLEKLKGDRYTMESTLKPCPFCGGEPEIEIESNAFSDNDFIRIECTGCRNRTADYCISTNERPKKIAQMYSAHESAVNAWNKRTGRYEKLVPHGEWQYKEGLFHCSLCGCTAFTSGNNWCPDCGAKMDQPERRST